MGDDDAPEDADRAAILKRRQRFVRAALTSMAASSLAACQPCLSPPFEEFDAGAPEDDAGATGDDGGIIDAGPQPCLSPLLDAGTAETDAGESGDDAGANATDAGAPKDGGALDAGPQPCLSIAIDGGPQPCLSPPWNPPDAGDDDGGA